MSKLYKRRPPRHSKAIGAERHSWKARAHAAQERKEEAETRLNADFLSQGYMPTITKNRKPTHPARKLPPQLQYVPARTPLHQAQVEGAGCNGYRWRPKGMCTTGKSTNKNPDTTSIEFARVCAKLKMTYTHCCGQSVPHVNKCLSGLHWCKLHKIKYNFDGPRLNVM